MKGWRFPLFGIVIGVIVATWLYPIAVQQIRQALPTSHWFEVHSMKVGSVESGAFLLCAWIVRFGGHFRSTGS